MLALIACGCHATPLVDCPSGDRVLDRYEIDGQTVVLGVDGQAWLEHHGQCRFEVQYFDPDFATQHYDLSGDTVVAITDEGDRIPTVSRFDEDFEGAENFVDLIATNVDQLDRFWTAFTAQSPDQPDIPAYNALRACILGGTCDFTDNHAEIVANPDDATDHVLRLTAVKPVHGMVTSKMSIDSGLPYFVKGMDLWYQASYLADGALPYSVVDFENPYFEGSPGPRVVISGGALAVEDKFGVKTMFRQDEPVPVPLGTWFTLKVHLQLSDEDDGVVEVWQDGALVLQAHGKTLPTYHSIQASLEVGISASSVDTVLLIDDVRLSDEAL